MAQSFEEWLSKENKEEATEKITIFLSTLRSENTRKVARQIIEYLFKRREEQLESRENRKIWQGGWIRASEIFITITDQNPRTISRMLVDLSQNGLIERKECNRLKGHPGKPPVFYRAPLLYSPRLLLPREELLKEIEEYQEELLEVKEKCRAAYSILKEIIGKEEADIQIETRIMQFKEKYAEFDKLKEELSLKEKDPCKSL